MTKRVLILMCALFVVLAPAGAASAQGYPPGGPCSVTISDSTPAPGDIITVVAAVPEGSSIAVFLGTDLIGTDTAGSDGIASITFEVPNLGAGTYSISVEVDAGCGDNVLGTTFTIPAPGGGLPVTGTSSTFPLAKLGVALIGAGGVLALVARRQRNTVKAAA